MKHRKPFTVEEIDYDESNFDARVRVRVREYPAGTLTEFVLPEAIGEAIFELVLDAHSADLKRLSALPPRETA